MNRVFTQYFQSLFSTSNLAGIKESIAEVNPRVTASMNVQLQQDFIVEGVEVALNQMHPLKSSSPDGFAACFYKQHWSSVGQGVRVAVLHFLNTRMMEGDLNATYIALIPKVSPATKVTDFLPISLCNVLYKLIAKVLENRMKQILP